LCESVQEKSHDLFHASQGLMNSFASFVRRLSFDWPYTAVKTMPISAVSSTIRIMIRLAPLTRLQDDLNVATVENERSTLRLLRRSAFADAAW